MENSGKEQSLSYSSTRQKAMNNFKNAFELNIKSYCEPLNPPAIYRPNKNQKK